MPRATLQDALDSRIPQHLNISPTDSRAITFINSACQRLITKGHWVGTVQNYAVAVASPNVRDQIFTLPPQFATMEGIAVSRVPTPIRPVWYMYAGGGIGTVRSDDTTNGISQAIHLGNFCTFRDITGIGKKLRLQCDLASDIGKQVVAIGMDDSGNIIRSLQGGVWSDGEVITLAQSPGTLSSNNFSTLLDLQFPAHNGQVWAYSYDGSANTLIGQYQHWERRPSYRRYSIPILANQTADTPFLEIVGKMNFIPAVNPNDYLPISNLEAVKLGAKAVKLEEEGFIKEAAILMNGQRDDRGRVIVEGALTILDQELQHFEGDAAEPVMRVKFTSADDPVEALI